MPTSWTSLVVSCHLRQRRPRCNLNHSVPRLVISLARVQMPPCNFASRLCVGGGVIDKSKMSCQRSTEKRLSQSY